MRPWRLVLLSLVLAGPASAEELPSWSVPYRVTTTHHILVRARLNGRGPYHFLLDTGAPTLYVGTAVGRKLGLKPDANAGAVVERFEIEGGVALARVPARIEDPFQIEGMNKLGLAGVELHGVIGYHVLARFRIELDLTRDRMTWSRLAFDPPFQEVPRASVPPELDGLGGLTRLLAARAEKRPEIIVKPRGFLGVELAMAEEAVVVRAVLPDSPAAAAGLRVGDVVQEIQGQKVQSGTDVLRRAADLAEGDVLRLTIRRGNQERTIEVRLGQGF